MKYEADPRHRERILDEVGLEPNSNPLDCPVARDTAEGGDRGVDEEHEADELETRNFRAVAARANYLGQDRPDVQFAAKELCRDMARPSADSWRKAKKVGRYLVGAPRLVWKFEEKAEEPECIEAFADSDWAGCKDTRKSTSGGMLVVGGVCLKSWSSTQTTVALSSGEAELYALVKAACEGLGLQSIARDLGWDLPVRVLVDSSAAKSASSRLGVGRLRHVEVKQFWIQEVVASGRVTLLKIRSEENPADVLTKPLSCKRMADLLGRVGGDLETRARKPRWCDFEEGDECPPHLWATGAI